MEKVRILAPENERQPPNMYATKYIVQVHSLWVCPCNVRVYLCIYLSLCYVLYNIIYNSWLRFSALRFHYVDFFFTTGEPVQISFSFGFQFILNTRQYFRDVLLSTFAYIIAWESRVIKREKIDGIRGFNLFSISSCRGEVMSCSKTLYLILSFIVENYTDHH